MATDNTHINVQICFHCKHWERPEHLDDYGSCRKTYAEGGPFHDDTIAWADSDEGRYAILRTVARFACPMWASRPVGGE